MFLRTGVLFIVLAGVLRIPVAAGPQAVSPATQESPAFREFTQRVQEYLKLRKATPRERTTKHQEEIVDRRYALAQVIREARSGAKQGDIFSPEIADQFLKIIRSTLQGANVRKTIRQGEPVASVRVTVNGAYPEHLPLTTVPPTLLLRLPQLPERLAYRIVGHDFVLQDTEARLVIDFIPDAIP
jgi:hypothetical protein